MSGRGFRFGLHFWELPTDSWVERVRRYEQLGFSSITFTDHQVVPQWEPLTALAALASVTTAISLGTLVLDMAMRNPVLTAKSAATIDRISGGRLELGLGAGYVERNFAAVGMPFQPATERIARLEESLTLMRQVWTQASTTLHGRFYDVTDVPMVASEPVRPTILIGGGGPKMMDLAGRVADIVSMIPTQDTGDWSVTASLADATVERMARKASWVRQGAKAASRDAGGIELHTMVARTIVGDDIGAAIDRESAATGVPVATMAGSTLYLIGSGAEARERLQLWRDEIWISHVSLFDLDEEQIDRVAEEIVTPLCSR
jgi:probable F420-dependent oxidoreductase